MNPVAYFRHYYQRILAVIVPFVLKGQMHSVCDATVQSLCESIWCMSRYRIILVFVLGGYFLLYCLLKMYFLIPMLRDGRRAEKWLVFLYYDRCLKPICCPSHILLKGYPWEPLIWWMLSNSFVQTKRLGKVNHLPQPRDLGWFFVCESSKA